MTSIENNRLATAFGMEGFHPNKGSWCLEMLAVAHPTQYDEVFRLLSVQETLCLLKALNPPLRRRVIRGLGLAPAIKARIEKGLMPAKKIGAR